MSSLDRNWRNLALATNDPAACPKSSVCGQADRTISCAAISSTWQVRFAGVIGQAEECQTEQGPLSASSGQSGSLSCGPSLGSNLGDCKRHISQQTSGQRCPAAHVRVGRDSSKWILPVWLVVRESAQRTRKPF